MEKILKKPYITICSDCANIIRWWKDYFPNMHVLTYDRLCASPSDFLKEISNLLKIRNQWDDEIIGKRVWSDESNTPIPMSIYALLKEQYFHKMEELYSLTGIPEVKQWLYTVNVD